MSAFTSKLQVELVDQQAAKGRGTWRVTSPLSYESDVAGQNITVPTDFITDFASVPRWPPLFFSVFGDIASEAAVIHDYLYAAIPFSRYKCDCVLKEAALTTGCPQWQALGLFIGVRIGGWLFYGKKKS